MSEIKTVKQRLNNGKTVLMITMGPMTTPKMVEFVAHEGVFDAIWFDQEHTPSTHKELENLFIACRAGGIDAVVRVPPTDYATLMRPLEMGASGLLVAQSRTVEDVKRIVSWVKYPPEGIRGLYSFNHESNWGVIPPAEQIAKANREHWLSIQIETVEAVNCVEQIAQIEGVDHLFIGPGDLSCTLGHPGDPMHRTCLAAMQRIADAAKNADIHWGLLTRGPDHAMAAREMGATLFSITSEFIVIRQGIAAAKEAYADFF